MPKTTPRSKGRVVEKAKILRAQIPGTDVPSSKGVPPSVFPIGVHEEHADLAPQPLVDRYPIVVGQSISATYLASVFRLCTTGYRSQYVDLLNELLEHDPHLLSVLSKRITSSANGRLEITPADLPKGHPEADAAKEVADFCQQELSRVPELSQMIARVLWAIYFGITTEQIFWTRNSDGWHIERFGFVHSRRLSYPDSQSWSLHIWDQGQVYGWQSPWGATATNSGIFGLKIETWPGKFLVHAPQIHADYPTREGLGRQVAIWSLFKRIGGRGAASYLERFAKTFMDITYSTQGGDNAGKPREADDEDIAEAGQLGASIGPGSGSYAVHPDSIQINPKSYDGGAGASSKLTFLEWIQLCNAEISKAVLGGTLGTDVGKGGGNRALGEVQERAEVDLEQFDAECFCQSFKRDVLTTLVRLNRPDKLHLVPNAVLHVDTDPEPKALVEVAKGLTEIGAPVDVDALAEETGIRLVPNEEMGEDGLPKPRRSFLSDVVDPHTVDDTLMSDQARQDLEEQKANDHEIALTKAQQPSVVGGPGGPGANAGAKDARVGKPPKKSGKIAKKTPAKPKKLSDKPVEAAIVVVHDMTGRVLTVSRPEPPFEMAIPGGQVDDGETPEQAGIREIAEETGIEILSVEAHGSLRSPVDGAKVHVFVATDWLGNAHPREPATRVAWLTPAELIDQATVFRESVQLLLDARILDRIGEPTEEELRAEMRDTVALLLDAKSKHVPREVFDQLLEDYPAKKLAWVLAAHWTGPTEILTSAIDTKDASSWRASHEPIEPYIERIQNGRRKPVILVKTPNGEKYRIVDGHHRFLACVKLGIPVLAFIATVHTDEGPWNTLHADQRSGSSRGSFVSNAA